MMKGCEQQALLAARSIHPSQCHLHRPNYTMYNVYYIYYTCSAFMSHTHTQTNLYTYRIYAISIVNRRYIYSVFFTKSDIFVKGTHFYLSINQIIAMTP